jgi:hypothetical protein
LTFLKERYRRAGMTPVALNLDSELGCFSCAGTAGHFETQGGSSNEKRDRSEGLFKDAVRGVSAAA